MEEGPSRGKPIFFPSSRFLLVEWSQRLDQTSGGGVDREEVSKLGRTGCDLCKYIYNRGGDAWLGPSVLHCTETYKFREVRLTTNLRHPSPRECLPETHPSPSAAPPSSTRPPSGALAGARPGRPSAVSKGREASASLSPAWVARLDWARTRGVTRTGWGPATEGDGRGGSSKIHGKRAVRFHFLDPKREETRLIKSL